MKNLTHYQKSEKYLEQAEIARQKGNRNKFLELTKKAEQEKELQVQENHKSYVENIKKEFPIGLHIENIGTIKEIKDGCGTKRGWVEIYINDKKYSPQELRKKISDIEAGKEAKKTVKIIDNKICFGEDIYNIIHIMGLEKAINTYEEIEENNIDYLFETRSDAEKQAIEDGYTDAEAEEQGYKAEEKEQEELYKKWLNSIEYVIEQLFEKHKLELIQTKEKRSYKNNKNKIVNYEITVYYASPVKDKTWKDVADCIRETINGVGYFYYDTLDSFIETCDNAINVSKSHLHWLKDYPRVYGTTSISSMADHAWR